MIKYCEKRMKVGTAGPLRQRRPAAGQGGMTALGALILILFIGFCSYAFIRLTPVYLNYMKVAGVLDGVQKEFDGQNPTLNAIRTSIGRRFDVESVSEISARDIRVMKDNGNFRIRADYEHTTPYIGNVSFTVHFDKEVLVRQ